MELAAIIKNWQPSDEDYLDLLEDAFLSYQIDSLTYQLTCMWSKQQDANSGLYWH